MILKTTLTLHFAGGSSVFIEGMREGEVSVRKSATHVKSWSVSGGTTERSGHMTSWERIPCLH